MRPAHPVKQPNPTRRLPPTDMPIGLMTAAGLARLAVTLRVVGSFDDRTVGSGGVAVPSPPSWIVSL
jgi:hypothetical protein